MRAFVTGATGFIGSHVARALLAEGWEVRALRRATSPGWVQEGPPPEWVPGDLEDEAALERACVGCDAVFHVAAHYALWADDEAVFQRVNVEGTRRVLRAARKAGVPRVVHTSSVACVGQAPPGGLATEDTLATFADLCGGYERSKFAAEQLALEAARSGQDVVVVNPASSIGPGDVKPTPTGKIVLDFLRGRMPFYLETGLNFVDVRDVAQGHLLAYAKGRAGQRYILGHPEGNRSLKEFLVLLGAAAGRPAPRLKIPYALAWLAGATSTLVADRLTHRPPAVPRVGVECPSSACSSTRARP
ncbi:MAG: NAD-dependent epimerase/dehydratase family protein [Planctomycetota bacterium]